MHARWNPHPSVKGINLQGQRESERKPRWMRHPHSSGAGRRRGGGVTGSAGWDSLQQSPCQGDNGDGSKETCCDKAQNQRDGSAGHRWEAGAVTGQWSQSAGGVINPQATTSLLGKATPLPPPWVRLHQRSSELGSPDTVGGSVGVERARGERSPTEWRDRQFPCSL